MPLAQVYFLGSGEVIAQTGPVGAIIAYIFGGLIAYMVMLCLGELAVHMPVSGSFGAYAKQYIWAWHGLYHHLVVLAHVVGYFRHRIYRRRVVNAGMVPAYFHVDLDTDFWWCRI